MHRCGIRHSNKLSPPQDGSNKVPQERKKGRREGKEGLCMLLLPIHRTESCVVCQMLFLSR